MTDRGYIWTFLTCRSFIISFRGENPTDRCSGSSENALRNPSAFFCRKSRMIKASVDCEVILGSESVWCQSFSGWEWTHFSAWSTIIPLMSSTGMSERSMSTTKMREVTDTSPPCLYRACLPIDETHSLRGVTEGRIHRSLELISNVTMRSPGFLHPIMLNSSPIPDSSAGVAFTRRTSL